MSALTLGLLLGGLVLLVLGGELLVRGGSGLGRSLGLSPLVVGLTIVSSATSAPELAVTLGASLSGDAGIAVGNVVGSNIVNVLVVLGASAVVLPLVVRRQLVRGDVPVMIAASVLLLLLALDGRVSRLDGLVLLAVLAGYLVWAVRLGRRDSAAERAEASAAGEDPAPTGRTGPARDLLLVAVGVALLVVGAGWLVDAASEIAEAAGVSDLVVGLTVVALGTSLPELATSVIAAVRGERELAVGNVVGSNIFNIGAVMGAAAALSPGGVPVSQGAVRFDLPVMLITALVLLPVVYTGMAVARWEGALFLVYYGAYVAYLLLDAADHDALPWLSTAMVAVVLPLTVLTLVLQTLVERRRRPAERGRL